MPTAQGQGTAVRRVFGALIFGFHAPQEAERILGEAIDHFREGQVALRPLPGARR
jgi:hypothetical protein